MQNHRERVHDVQPLGETLAKAGVCSQLGVLAGVKISSYLAASLAEESRFEVSIAFACLAAFCVLRFWQENIIVDGISAKEPFRIATGSIVHREKGVQMLWATSLLLHGMVILLDFTREQTLHEAHIARGYTHKVPPIGNFLLLQLILQNPPAVKPKRTSTSIQVSPYVVTVHICFSP